ncbi:MAG TPA: FHA domain-containing protein [Blastocatellia bacterium]|nr:FHA domain-containing protein [Blastocatellia bacterium]
MIRCNNCGTNNIDGSEYCDECGMKLDASPPPMVRSRDLDGPPVYQPPAPPSAVTNDPGASDTVDGPLPMPPSFTTSTSMPKPAIPAREARPAEPRGRDRLGEPGPRNPAPYQGAPNERQAGRHHPVEKNPIIPAKPDAGGQTMALSSRGRTDVYRGDSPNAAPPEGATAKLVIERGGRVGRQFPITGIETNIGRWDADSGIFPDVDLDEDDPEAKISRRHARIINQNGQYFIEDLGSTNGTFVNRGRRLLPGKRHMLQNGDEVIVGKTFLKFQILR